VSRIKSESTTYHCHMCMRPFRRCKCGDYSVRNVFGKLKVNPSWDTKAAAFDAGHKARERKACDERVISFKSR
jgi:hypothetical protein